MKCNRRSFLHSLGAALCSLALPKKKPAVHEGICLGGFLDESSDNGNNAYVAADEGVSKDWWPAEGLVYSTGVTWGLDKGVGHDYTVWMRYPRASWTFEWDEEQFQRLEESLESCFVIGD